MGIPGRHMCPICKLEWTHQYCSGNGNTDWERECGRDQGPFGVTTEGKQWWYIMDEFDRWVLETRKKAGIE